MMEKTCLECGAKLQSSSEIIFHTCKDKENQWK